MVLSKTDGSQKNPLTKGPSETHVEPAGTASAQHEAAAPRLAPAPH